MAASHNEMMEGIEVQTKDEPIRPLFTEDEKRILEVYDRLEELQFEIALLRAQGVLSSQDQPEGEVSEQDLTSARKELLEAKATYQIRKSVIESVLITNPVLKAVHAGTNATLIEQDLLPLIQQRDELSITLTQVSKELLTARNDLQQMENQNMIMARENADLARQMLALAAEANTQKKEDVADPVMRDKLEELEAEMKSSRQKWRIIKGTASATIVGSGIDWAGDPALVDIVLDNEG